VRLLRRRGGDEGEGKPLNSVTIFHGGGAFRVPLGAPADECVATARPVSRSYRGFSRFLSQAAVFGPFLSQPVDMLHG
jgi:hypothetical protein